MANWFVDDSVADNSGTGLTSGSPKKYLWLNDVGGNAVFNETVPPAAGDTVYVLENHVEDHGAVGANLINNGVLAAPIKVITVTNLTTPTTLGAKSNSVIKTSSGGADLARFGVLVFQGFELSTIDFLSSGTDTTTKLIDGQLTVDTFSDRYIVTGNSGQSGGLILENSDVVSSVSGAIFYCAYGSYLKMTGGVISATGTAKVLTGSLLRGATVDFVGVDMSSVLTIISGTSADASGKLNFYDCKFNPSLVAVSGSIGEPAVEILIDNSSSSSTVSNRTKALYLYSGECVSDTAVTRNAQTPAGNSWSFRLAPNTNVSEFFPVRTLAIPFWADFSTSRTIDIYIGNNTRDLTDADIYPILSYPGYNQGGSKVKIERGASWLVSTTTWADDTVSTWAGGGLTYMQKISITAGGATDGREGPAVVELFLVVDIDVYIDPEFAVS